MEKEQEIFSQEVEFEETKKKLQEAEEKALYLKVCNDSLTSKMNKVQDVTREWQAYADSIL